MSSRGLSVVFVRRALAAIVLVDILSFVWSLSDARAAALARGAEIGVLTSFFSAPPVMAILALGGAAAAVAFGLKAARLWQGVLALAVLASFSTTHAYLFGSPWRHLYFSGLCLAGWLLGLIVSRRQGVASDEAYACTGSMAFLGASYLNAGISKLVFGGPGWLSGVTIQSVILGQDGLVADGMIASYRVWAAMTPAVAAALAVATTGLELAGPLFVIGRRVRMVVCLGLFAMHFNIWILTPILYWQSMLLLLLFGFSADVSPVDVLSRNSLLTDGRKVAAIAALLAILALVGIRHQSQRFAQNQGVEDVESNPKPPAAPAATAVPTAIPLAPTLVPSEMTQ